jgi:hypothetical protein
MRSREREGGNGGRGGGLGDKSIRSLLSQPRLPPHRACAVRPPRAYTLKRLPMHALSSGSAVTAAFRSLGLILGKSSYLRANPECTRVSKRVGEVRGGQSAAASSSFVSRSLGMREWQERAPSLIALARMPPTRQASPRSLGCRPLEQLLHARPDAIRLMALASDAAHSSSVSARPAALPNTLLRCLRSNVPVRPRALARTPPTPARSPRSRRTRRRQLQSLLRAPSAPSHSRLPLLRLELLLVPGLLDEAAGEREKLRHDIPAGCCG